MKDHFFVKTALFVVVYFCVGRLGMMLAIPPGNVTPVYPAAGLAWAMVLLYGNRALIGVFLGGLLANWQPIFNVDSLASGLFASITIGCGEVLAVVIATYIFRRFCLDDNSLISKKSIVCFSVIGVLWLVSPTIGVSALYSAGFIDANDYFRVWTTWWLGDSIGILLATPIILLTFTLKRKPIGQLHLNAINLSIILGILFGSAVVFSNVLPVMYLLTLALFLAAFRLAQLGLVIANIVIASIAIYATLSGQGPIANFEPEISLFMLQLFIAVNIISSLLFWSNIRHIKLLGVNLSHEKFIAREDPLTGILNRRGFEELASLKMNQSHSDNKLTYFVMYDIDNFKQINDTYGHPVGDKVLQAVTQRVSTCIRKQDIFGRVGGEEFALLLLNATEEQALALSERICQSVSELDFPSAPQGSPKITISIGTTQLTDSEQLHATFDRVDRLLYQAKKEGKNRVVMG